MQHRQLRGGAILVSMLLVAGCGGASPPAPTDLSTTEATAGSTAFNGQIVQITAKSLTFSPVSVTVKSGTDFEIRLDNQDELSHAIYVTPGKRPLGMKTLEEYEKGPYPFKGEYVQANKTITYHVGALAPGAYQFFCPPHLDMVISVTVE